MQEDIESGAKHVESKEADLSLSGLASVPWAALVDESRLREWAEVVTKTEDYLRRTQNRFEPDADAYFSRLALSQALEAIKEGNIGVGAVALDVRPDGQIHVYGGRNSLVTHSEMARSILPPEFLEIFGHAEMVANGRLITGDVIPDAVISASNPLLDAFRERPGTKIYTTVEPCMMCEGALTNDRRVNLAVATIEDPVGAHSIGERRASHQPRAWTQIQDNQEFVTRLAEIEARDVELRDLSEAVFEVSVRIVDEWLTKRGIES